MKALSFKYFLLTLILGSFALPAFAHDDEMLDLTEDMVSDASTCVRATKTQISYVQSGNEKRDSFMEQCKTKGITSELCEQLTQPNPASAKIFTCTYGTFLPHQLIDPDESTWEYAFQGAKIVMELQKNNVKVNRIYNWWRPEPYNKNVGGAPGRHPEGTSIDVRMSDMNNTTKARALLCKWRSNNAGYKALNALGYYGSTGIHFGVADNWENTWGDPCKFKK